MVTLQILNTKWFMAPNIMLALINILQDNLLYLTFQTWVGWEGQNVAVYNLWALIFVCFFFIIIKLNLKSIVCFLLSLLADVQALGGLQGIFWVWVLNDELWKVMFLLCCLPPSLCIPMQPVWQGCVLPGSALGYPEQRGGCCDPTGAPWPSDPSELRFSPISMKKKVFWVSNNRFFTRAGRK